MRRHDHGAAPPGVGEDRAQLQTLFGIEPRFGLVDHEQLRRTDRRGGDGDASAGAARHRLDLLVHRIGQADQSEHTADLVASLGCVPHLPEDGDVVDEVEGGEAEVQAGVLREVAEPTADPDALVGRRAGSSPNSRSVPASGASTVASIRSSVDLPEPFGPSRPMTRRRPRGRPRTAVDR